MNTITITFSYEKAKQPKYKFGDRVASVSDCDPKDWLVGKVIGLQIEESFLPVWCYTVKLDNTVGLTTEDFLEDELVSETKITIFQKEWEEGKAAWIAETTL